MKLYTPQVLACAVLTLFLVQGSIVNAQLNRTYDGVGNNITNPYWGAAKSELIRWVPADYADGYREPAGQNRPSPRLISNEIFSQSGSLVDLTGLSDYCWAFGQFIDHDITHTGDGPEFIMIPVPADDRTFDPLRTGVQVIPMHRSDTVDTQGENRPRQHANSITAFIDGSGVYGSSKTHADWLRTFRKGKLKLNADGTLPYNTIDGTKIF